MSTGKFIHTQKKSGLDVVSYRENHEFCRQLAKSALDFPYVLD